MANRRSFATNSSESKPAVSELDALERSELQALIGGIVESHGLWCEEVVVGGAPGDRVLSVFVDRIDDGDGVILDTIADVTHEISSALDAQGDDIPEIGTETYTLEVSTPGTDRPLVRQHHWEKNLGRVVNVMIDGDEPIDAKIHSVDGDGVELVQVIPGAKKGMPVKYSDPQHYRYEQLSNAIVQVQLK
ncbi:ribosome maturation factor RimP [Yaniella halotolerans]|uniref:ribosome maturation factor RimP n=1 Tax=Yaniella halotolerans TaxID=225453 RepID=UPI0003B44F76|nr:ribosome assembly cofactor RimP [Yaniella halotolerans]